LSYDIFLILAPCSYTIRMYGFHTDRKYYFDFIHKTADGFIVPFIEEYRSLRSADKVLEIGCAEGGVLKAFTDRGHQSMGIELSEKRVALANEFMSEEVDNKLVQFVSKDIYDIDTESELPFKFDVILLKDVIEHIFHQEKFMARLDQFMSSDGLVFFGFPPWQMPFGGHQQVLKSKLLSKIPYFHLLPRFLYKWILTIFGESEYKIKEMMELTETGLSVEKFERYVTEAGFQVVKKRHYLINPVYSFKFGLKPRKQLGLISAIPYLRNFLTTGVYYLIQKK